MSQSQPSSWRGPSDGTLRLLPWATFEGKPCFLSTDPGGNGFLSRLADEAEVEQLGAAAEVLESARAVLGDLMSPYGELRYTSLRLSRCLADTLRIAESRGARIPASGGDRD